MERGEEGLRGGVFFYYTRWVNLLTGEKGPTINAAARERRAFEERNAA
jgi:hypothetical protein